MSRGGDWGAGDNKNDAEPWGGPSGFPVASGGSAWGGKPEEGGWD